MFAAKVGNRNAHLVLFPDRDNLFFRKSATLPALVLKLGQHELQTGLNRGGRVTTDVGVKDRRCVRWSLVRVAPIEVVVEDAFDEAIGARVDLDCAFGGGFKPLRSMGATKLDDAKAGAEELVPILIGEVMVRTSSHHRIITTGWRKSPVSQDGKPLV